MYTAIRIFNSAETNTSETLPLFFLENAFQQEKNSFSSEETSVKTIAFGASSSISKACWTLSERKSSGKLVAVVQLLNCVELFTTP